MAKVEELMRVVDVLEQKLAASGATAEVLLPAQPTDDDHLF